MFRSLRTLVVLQRRLIHTNASLSCLNSGAASITINPATCLVDEKIHIQVTGLAVNQVITLISSLEEGGSKFEARGVFQANKDGSVDNRHSPSLAGTFASVDQMGLFWSMKPTPGQKPGIRLAKKDVSTPLDFTISVYDGSHADDVEIHQTPLTTAVVNRLYKSPSVRRIPVKEGIFRGTIFVPEGDGPFPGLIDTFGGLVSLIETRAALLASHGYATFALSYLHPGQAKTLMQADPNYFTDAVEWFSQQEYVNEERVGAYGLCYGGCLSLISAAMTPRLRVVVNVNGISMMPFSSGAEFIPGKTKVPTKDSSDKQWPNPGAVYCTDEGIVIRDIYDSDDLMCFPAWQNGAKVLIICGEDDKQVHPKWHQYFVDHWPEEYRSNVELVKYPGAGHLIEPPYSPLTRAVNPGPARMETIDFVKENFREELFMTGGFPEQHAYAQEDAWRRVLEFLKKHL